ncbi:MAG: hypothetical protein AABO41_06370 [Acidobacteriota bacterium]
MPIEPLDIVRKGLQAYADRGVFRGFDEVKARNGKRAFRFVWLGNRPLEFSLDVENHVLSFNKLLPNVSSKSMMYSDLSRFVKSRSDRSVPKHRRVEPRYAEVVCANRRGEVSITLTVRNNRYEYGLNKLVNLAHEIFVQLSDKYADYMTENFDLPQE